MYLIYQSRHEIFWKSYIFCSFGIDYSGAYSIVDYIVRSLGKNGNSVDVFESALALLKGRMSTIHSAVISFFNVWLNVWLNYLMRIESIRS